MRTWNPPAIFVLSLLFGAATALSVLGAEAYLLSVTEPVYGAFAGVLAGVGFWIFLRFLNLGTTKFAHFNVRALSGYLLILCTLGGPWIPTVPRAVAWLFLAVFSHRFYRWSITQLVIRHLDPARAQSHLSWLVALYDLGMALPLAALLLTGSHASPERLLVLSLSIGFVATLLLRLQFWPATNLEISFARKHAEEPFPANPAYEHLIRVFSLLALCFGIFKLSEEYLIRLSLKSSLHSFEDIRRTVSEYRLASHLGITLVGSGLSFLLARRKISPTTAIQVVFLGLLGFTGAAALRDSLSGFIALEIARWIGENGLWYLSTQMIGTGLFGPFRGRLGLQQNFYFYVVAGLPLLLLFTVVQHFYPEIQAPLLLALTSVSLAICAALTLPVRARLSEALYAFGRSTHKSAAILAINLISFLRPRGYERELSTLLTLQPKKLLRKTIILSLGHSQDEQSLDAVIREFASDQEEIQLAVVSALQVSQRYRAAKFLTQIIRAEVRPRTIRVRVNAATALGALYGKYAIPFLLSGLDDPDPRIVANTLETLSEFKDRKLIPTFESYRDHPNLRVRTNALLGLGRFWSTRTLARARLEELLQSGDAHTTASALYVVGRLRDRALLSTVLRIAQSPTLQADESVERCTLWAQIELEAPGHREAFVHFVKNCLTQNTPGKLRGFLHFFAQLEPELRMDLLAAGIDSPALSHEQLLELATLLEERNFDFHEELDYFHVLLAARPGAVYPEKVSPA